MRIESPTTAFVNEDAARLSAVSEPESRKNSFNDVAGTNFEREKLTRITEHTEQPDFAFSSFYESSGSNEDDLLQMHYEIPMADHY